jgi:hypothetical protein
VIPARPASGDDRGMFNRRRRPLLRVAMLGGHAAKRKLLGV